VNPRVVLRGPGDPAPELAIRSGETVIVIGKPGTGKSTLAAALLSSVSSIVAYDTKGDPREQAEWQARGFELVRDPDDLDLYPRAMMLVPHAWLFDLGAKRNTRHPWSRALEHPFRRHPSVVLFDECLNVFPVAGGHPGTYRLLQQGRSFGHISIVLSQAANGINTLLLRLAQHIFVLGPVESSTDLDYLGRATGTDTSGLRALGKRSIAWRHEGGSWTTFEPLDVSRPDRLTGRSTEPHPGLHPKMRPRWNWHLYAPTPTSRHYPLRILLNPPGVSSGHQG